MVQVRGAAVSVAGSVVSSTGYTYGALAAPIAFLLAFLFVGFAIILGAHLNASIQARWPVPVRDRRGRQERSSPGDAGAAPSRSGGPGGGGRRAPPVVMDGGTAAVGMTRRSQVLAMT